MNIRRGSDKSCQRDPASSALRHSSNVTVQSVQVFIHVRLECIAGPSMRIIRCSPLAAACAVSSCCRMISAYDVFGESHAGAALLFAGRTLPTSSPFPPTCALILCALSCRRSSCRSFAGSQHAERQSRRRHCNLCTLFHRTISRPLSHCMLYGWRTEVAGVCVFDDLHT